MVKERSFESHKKFVRGQHLARGHSQNPKCPTFEVIFWRMNRSIIFRN